MSSMGELSYLLDSPVKVRRRHQNRSSSQRRATDHSLSSTDSPKPFNQLTPSRNAMPYALNAQRKRKSKLITKLRRKHRDLFVNEDRYNDSELTKMSMELVKAFRQLAISDGGLLDDKHRKGIWRLLACDIRQFAVDETRINQLPQGIAGSRDFDKISMSDDFSDCCSINDSIFSTADGECITSANFLDEIDTLKAHPEWRQVEMDVRRTLARFPPDISDIERVHLQEILIPLVVSVIVENDQYRYYQGFHDVCLTLLLVIKDPQQTQEACSCLAQYGIFRRFLREPLELAAPMLSHLIYVILHQADPELEAYLRKAELGHLFALSWMLTWFAHNIDNSATVIRLYDFFLASHCLMPIYFGAALICLRSEEIMKCDCEMAPIHSLLTRGMPRHFPVEALITDAQDLFMQYPPTRLRGDLLERYDQKVIKGQQIILRAPPGISVADFIRRNLDISLGPNSVTIKNQLSKASTVVCAVTATAAAWYIYSKFGTTQLSWAQLF